MQPGLSAYLVVAGLLFLIGVGGLLLNRRNVIVILMCIEMMLIAVNINFVAFGAFWGQTEGMAFGLMILTVAAAEAALGLALLVITFRNRGSVVLDDMQVRED
jgi:NADH-quinone oxidoreductase subunit K